MKTLDRILNVLRNNRAQLEARGVQHAAVFGSVARGDDTEQSDVDVLVELQPENPIGIFKFVNLQREISELLGCRVDLVERAGLHPRMKARIESEAVSAF